jgi:hypothetical protein
MSFNKLDFAAGSFVGDDDLFVHLDIALYVDVSFDFDGADGLDSETEQRMVGLGGATLVDEEPVSVPSFETVPA